VLAPVPARAAPTAQAVDLVVLIDNSGSMSANDPSGLRYKVPGLVAKELTGDDRLGVLVFSLAVDRQLPLGAVPTAAEIGRGGLSTARRGRRYRLDSGLGGSQEANLASGAAWRPGEQ